VIAKHLMRTKAGKALLSLLVLAFLAVTLQSLVFSDASFTKTSGNPGNAFTAGTLAHANSKAGQVVLDATNIRPGQTKTGTLTITGGGDLTGTYTLTKVSLVDTPASPGLSNALTLQIQDVTSGSTSLYNGVAASFTSASLGTIAPGVVRTFQFSLFFPTTPANSALQGDSMTLTLQFAGAST
jgi:spore coat-associated protein N